jgi:hypothetical protein
MWKYGRTDRCDEVNNSFWQPRERALEEWKLLSVTGIREVPLSNISGDYKF